MSQPNDEKVSERAQRAVALLTYVEAARRLKCCVKTVRKYVKAGALRVVRFGRSVRITEHDLAEFIERCGSGSAVALP